MRRLEIFVHGKSAGILEESTPGAAYRFVYQEAYDGAPVSLRMPVAGRIFVFDRFPPFFDGLLPEGIQLESLLHLRKIDRDDLMSQLTAVGRDMVGAVTALELPT